MIVDMLPTSLYSSLLCIFVALNGNRGFGNREGMLRGFGLNLVTFPIP